MEILCSDKTGTLTCNELSVNATKPLDGGDEARLLTLASLASAEGGEDPVDAAIRAAAEQKRLANAPKLVKFTPFDPVKKMAETSATDVDGQPLHIVKITGDFLGMSVTTDNVRQSSKPNHWQIGKLTLGCSVIAACLLAFCTDALLLGKYKLGLSPEALQTLSLTALVFGSEATLYALRERKRIWSSRPGNWVIVSSIADILIISLLAVRGITMHPLPFVVVACVLLSAILFAFLLDMRKFPVFKRLQIA